MRCKRYLFHFKVLGTPILQYHQSNKMCVKVFYPCKQSLREHNTGPTDLVITQGQQAHTQGQQEFEDMTQGQQGNFRFIMQGQKI